MVTAVVAAARVPASSTSTRARCRMRPSALSAAGPSIRLVEVMAGLERSREAEQLVELQAALGGLKREPRHRRCPSRAPTSTLVPGSPIVATKCRSCSPYGRRGLASSACSNAPRRAIIVTSRRAVAGREIAVRGVAGRTGAPFAVEVLGVGNREEISSSTIEDRLEDARDHPGVQRFVHDHAFDRGHESSGPAAPRQRRARPRYVPSQPPCAPGRKIPDRAPGCMTHLRQAPRAGTRAGASGRRASSRSAGENGVQRPIRRVDDVSQPRELRGGCIRGSPAGPARARWPRTGP